MLKKTNEEILREAVRKAHQTAGFPEHWGHPSFNLKGDMTSADYNLIFSHDFAKAFWGDGSEAYMGVSTAKNAKQVYTFKRGDNSDFYTTQHAWEYHLQQMVLVENPLQYIENFL